MSADTPKYDTGRSNSRLVEDDVALTDHALHRWQERTPHECPVGVREAYRRGEDVRDPQVARSPNDMRTPERARVYVHAGHEWGVVFLIDAEDTPAAERPAHHTADYVVATVVDLGSIEHGPSKVYLHSHGPHGGGGQ
jgi:hypothetical protein